MTTIRRFRRFSLAHIVGVGLLASCAGAASAQTADNTVFFTGVDAVSNGVSGYGGFVYALNDDVTTTGWTVSGNFGWSRNWDNSVSPSSKSNSVSASVLLGYQWHTPDLYLGLSLGADYINNTESPSTGSVTEGRKTGYVVQAGFETKRERAVYLQGFATHLSANNRNYAQLRAGYRATKYVFGVEGVFSDEMDSSPVTRVGLFVGDIPFGKGGFGVSAGYQNDRGSSVNDGAYVSVEYSIPFSLR